MDPQSPPPTSDSPPTSPPRRWRGEAEGQVKRSKRELIPYLLVMGIVVVSIGLVLSWFQPVSPPVLVPLFLSRADSPLPQAERDRQAFLKHPMLMVRDREATVDPQPIRALDVLNGRTAEDVVIIALTARARIELNEDGRRSVVILPADAGNDRTSPGESLEELRRVLLGTSGAPRIVLMLDLHPESTDPRAGWGDIDLIGRVVATFLGDLSPHVLVMTSCAPGQRSLSSEILGRSIFSYYVEQGLNGWADVAPTDGRVTASELALYVRERVTRWAEQNRATVQTPLSLVVPSNDFVIVALPRGRPTGPPFLPDPKAVPAYPQWLLDGWKVRDAWRAERRGSIAPRIYARLESALLDTESAWRNGADPNRLRPELEQTIGRCEALFEKLTAVSFPRAVSLALERALGRQAAPEVAQAIRDLVAKRATLPPAEKPMDAEAADARLIAEFFSGLKSATDFDLASAVLEASASSREPSADLIAFLDRLLRVRQPQPLYVESLRLAEAASYYPSSDWSPEAVRLAIDVARRGEIASARPGAQSIIGPLIDKSHRTRYEAETLWIASGYVPASAAEERFRQAEALIDTANSAGDDVEAVRAVVSESLVWLPALAPHLERFPDLVPHWMNACRSTTSLGDALDSETTAGDEFVVERVAALRQSATRLRDDLERLKSPFGNDAIRRLITRNSKSAVHVRAIDDLLSTPFPAASDRAALWKVFVATALPLAEATIRLDARDNRTLRPGPVPSNSEMADLVRRDRVRTSRMAQTSVELLGLGSVDRTTLDHLQSALEVAHSESFDIEDEPHNLSVRPGSPVTGASNAVASLDRTWELLSSNPFRQGIPASAHPERLESVLSPTAVVPSLDLPETNPTRQARQRRLDALRRRLALQYAYRARDLDGAPFYAAAAQEYSGPDGDNSPVYLRIAVDSSQKPSLSPAQPNASVLIRFDRQGGQAAGETSTRVDILNGNPSWESLTLSRVSPIDRGPKIATETEPLWFPLQVAGNEPVDVTLNVRMLPEPDPARQTSLPRGFLVRARTAEWTFHRRVPVTLEPASRKFQAFLSAETTKPAPLPEVRIRPVGEPTTYHLFVKNPGERERRVRVSLSGRDGPIPHGEVELAIPGSRTVPVNFGLPTEKPEQERVHFRGPLIVRVTDAADPAILITEETIPVEVAPATDIVRIVEARFDPPAADANSKSKFSVKLRSIAPIIGPPCLAELVFPPGRIPGLLSEGEGTFRAELAKSGEEVSLFAGGLRFEEGEDEAGLVYLTIDGVPRAIVLRTMFARRGEPTQSRPMLRPAVRIAAETAARADAPLEVGLELDRPPDNAYVEVELGQTDGGSFRVDAKSRVRATRDQIQITPRGPAGSLAFEASVRDPIVKLPPVRVRGQRVLRARLLDADGNEIAYDEQVVTLDDRAPSRVRIVDPPKYAKAGAPLVLRATGTVPSSGLKKVIFFVGKPVEGKRPSEAASVAAQPLDDARTLWQAKFNLPAEVRGATPLSVEFVSGVSLSTFDTASVQVVDAIPVEPGRIQGVVSEGPRPQSGLDVILRDAKGAVLAQATTDRKGAFEFPGLPPGDYEVVSIKATPPTRGRTRVSVKPGSTAEADVSMSRVP